MSDRIEQVGSSLFRDKETGTLFSSLNAAVNYVNSINQPNSWEAERNQIAQSRRNRQIDELRRESAEMRRQCREFQEQQKRSEKIDEMVRKAQNLRQGIEDWQNVYADWGNSRHRAEHARTVTKAKDTLEDLERKLVLEGIDPNAKISRDLTAKKFVVIDQDDILPKKNAVRKIFILEDDDEEME